MKISAHIISCLLMITFLMQHKYADAQLAEFGIGISPAFLSGTRIESFDGGDQPTVNTVLEQEQTFVYTGNIMMGLYFPVVHFSSEFSVGANYEAIAFAGTMDGPYFDALLFGLDLPLWGEIRIGHMATIASFSNWGASAGAGIQYSLMSISLEEGATAYNDFIPSFNVGVTKKYTGGLRFAWHTGKFQTYYETNTGGIPRIELIKYHLTLYFYLGRF